MLFYLTKKLQQLFHMAESRNRVNIKDQKGKDVLKIGKIAKLRYQRVVFKKPRYYWADVKTMLQ